FVAPPEEIYTCFDVLGAATSRPRYTLDADFDWPSKSAEVTQTVRYTNLTDNPQERLVLHAEPNRYANGIQLAETRLNNTVIEGVSINITQMSIPLPEPLPPGCALELTLVYTLNVPPIEVGYYGRFGYLGYTSRQVNLGHWFPVVGLQRAGDWYTPRPYFVGEQTTAEMADFELRFTLQDAPPDVELAAAGDVVAEGDNQWTITLENARDLTLSLGDGFRRESVLATNDVVVELYHYPDVSAGIEFDAPRQALSAAADSMLLFEEQFGMDYPLERLVVVQGDFPDGMEFSGLIYVSEAWFRTWNGRLNSWLTTITVHEVAHQWWYLLVGNDPAEYPYMDEAFATYSEFLFYERFYENPDWWWDFRVRAHDVTAGAVDRSIYHFDNARGYINMAYLRGALMLHNLREELGDDAFFAWLQSYLRQHENRVATPDDLWGAMPEDALAETDATRRLYLQGAAALPTPIPDPTATPAD
ncbi:MAG: M1 family metallopeptidase, partial [Anaerolineales bacterium]